MHWRRRLWERGLVVWLLGLGFVLLGAIWALGATSAGAQTQGAERVQQGARIFQQTCAACHTIGAGVRVGPDLQGVTERRQESWLKVHIQSPSVHHNQNDPISVANRQQFGLPMPNLGLTDQEVEALIAHLGAGKPAPEAIPALYVPTLGAGVLAIVALTLLALRVATKKVEVRP